MGKKRGNNISFAMGGKRDGTLLAWGKKERDSILFLLWGKRGTVCKGTDGEQV